MIADLRAGPARAGRHCATASIKAATFEGMTPHGLVTDELIEFHRRVAAGGVGMTTVAYCAVAPEGRTERRQMHWQRRGDARAAPAHRCGARRGRGGLGADRPRRAGRRRRAATALPALSPSAIVLAAGAAVHAAATAGRPRADRGRPHADAARRADRGRLRRRRDPPRPQLPGERVPEPRLNRRRDAYGGSLENRARFPRAIASAVRDAVGDRIAIMAKLNLDDGVRRGLRIDEAIQVAHWLDADGSLDALEMTAGTSLLNPMYLFKGPAPLKEFAAAMREPVRTGVRLVRTHPAAQLPLRRRLPARDASRVRAAVDLPMILLGGVTNLDVMNRAIRGRVPVRRDGARVAARARSGQPVAADPP